MNGDSLFKYEKPVCLNMRNQASLLQKYLFIMKCFFFTKSVVSQSILYVHVSGFLDAYRNIKVSATIILWLEDDKRLLTKYYIRRLNTSELV